MNAIKFNYHLKFTLFVTLISFAEFFVGCTFVYSSVLLLQLREPTSSIKLNTDEASWIASISPLGSPFSLIIFGILSDKIGRRKALQISFVPIITSWLVLALANSYRTILIGRVLLGFTCGSASVAYVYLAEVSLTKHRPLYFSVMNVFVGLGMITIGLLAVFLHWRTVSAIMCAIASISLVSLFMFPESPTWLRAMGRTRDADKAERRFGAKEPATATNDHRGDPDDRQSAAQTTTCWSTYARRTVLVPTAITILFFACQQGTGLYVQLFYSGDVLADFGVPWNGVVVSFVFLSVSRMLGGVAFAAFHGVRRNTLTVVSCVGMASSLAAIVAHHRIFRDAVEQPAGGTAFLVVAFSVYTFSASLAMLPLPWMLCSEVFPRAISGTMNGIVQTCQFILMFTVLKIYPMMVSILGIEVIWSIFTIVCVLTIFFSIFIVPETKGISLDDILESFKSHKKTVENNLS